MIGYSRAFEGLYGPKPNEGKSKMNERIRELRRQATLVETYTTNSGTVAEGKSVDLEKFAKLIVKECAVPMILLGQEMDKDDRYKNHPKEVIAALMHQRLEKHFGVEE